MKIGTTVKYTRRNGEKVRAVTATRPQQRGNGPGMFIGVLPPGEKDKKKITWRRESELTAV